MQDKGHEESAKPEISAEKADAMHRERESCVKHAPGSNVKSTGLLRRRLP